MSATDQQLIKIAQELVKGYDENVIILHGMNQKFKELRKKIPMCNFHPVGKDIMGETPNNLISVNFYFWLLNQIEKGNIDISKCH